MHLTWHTPPEARALLAKLTHDNVELRKQYGIPNDYFEYVAKTDFGQRVLTALDMLRLIAIEASAGGTFEECEARGDALDYIALLEEAPNLYDAIGGALDRRLALAEAA